MRTLLLALLLAACAGADGATGPQGPPGPPGPQGPQGPPGEHGLNVRTEVYTMIGHGARITLDLPAHVGTAMPSVSCLLTHDVVVETAVWSIVPPGRCTVQRWTDRWRVSIEYPEAELSPGVSLVWRAMWIVTYRPDHE